jgi:tetratricopeptide (TPR) repeat protein
LSYDYSYNQIPYIEIDSASFAVSAIALIVLAAYAILKFKTKSIYAFSILYFIISISLVTNFIVDIGTPFSERLMFQPSLAFCIVIASLYLRFYKKIKLASALLLSCILFLFSLKTIARNSVWKNNETLIITDVISSPNSARTTLHAAEIYRFKAENENNEILKKEYLLNAIHYCKESMKINPAYAATYVSLGFAYFDQYDYNKAADYLIQGYRLDTTSSVTKKGMDVLSTIFYKQGNEYSDNGEIDTAIKYYLRSIDLKNDNAAVWYTLRENYLMKNDTINALKAWDRVKILDPNHAYILK